MKDGQIKIVVDTNVLFMAWYNPLGKCAKVLRKARQNKLSLFAPVSVKQELEKIFIRKGLEENEINNFLEDLYISWIEKEFYLNLLEKTTVKHKPDKDVEAVSLLLDCDLLSADTDFKNCKNRVNIDKLLEKLEIE